MPEPSPAIRDFISIAALEPFQLALILGPFIARLDVGLIDDVQDIVEKALAHGYKKGYDEAIKELGDILACNVEDFRKER